MFLKQAVAIALITYYPKWYVGKLKKISNTDKVRGDLALEFIQKAINLGYQVVAVDGHSSKSFLKQLNQFSELKIIKRRGHKRSPAKRQAFKAASNLSEVKVIIATEAEKVSLIDFLEVLVKPVLEEKVDIVVPKRQDDLFRETYPDYMYESEMEGNKLCNEQLKLSGILPKDANELDLFFGPRVFKNDKKVLALFLRKFLFSKEHFLGEYFDPEELANTQFSPVIIALKKGFKVKSVTVPFSYPKVQKENESIGAREAFEGKRGSQRMGLLLELMHLLNYLKK